MQNAQPSPCFRERACMNLGEYISRRENEISHPVNQLLYLTLSIGNNFPAVFGDVEFYFEDNDHTPI